MITAVIMAGGKGSRMNGTTEKPLIKVNHTPMIRYVIDALSDTSEISEIVIATSPNSPKTAKQVKDWGYEIFQTPGKGYIEDLNYLISERFSDDPDQVLLTITSDLPLINANIISKVIFEYWRCGKPALCTSVPVNFMKEHNLKPSIVLGDVVPSGLNILRSNNKQQDEEVLNLEKIELAVNINSYEDIVVLEELLSKVGLKI